MARPRGDEWLGDEIINLRKQNVGLLVSLLEKEETSELGLWQQEAFCKDNSIEFINFPIVDRDIPKKNSLTDKLIDLVLTKLTTGSSVVIHCRMGIGRSSIIAAAVLLHLGLKAETVIEDISKIRGLKVPDTDRQFQWLKARE